jgi:hypothetical protein
MKTFKKFKEDVVAAGPVNVTGSGAVAGMGQPVGSKSGEPGVHLKNKKKSNPIIAGMLARKYNIGTNQK